jgi:hypothetical protein
MKKLIFFLIFWCVSTSSFSQLDDNVTLVFKRPWVGAGDNHLSKISINGIAACTLDSESDYMVSCSHKVVAGETKIEITSIRGTPYQYIIDTQKGKTYTLVVYLRNVQTNDLIWSTIGSRLAKNKAPELPPETIINEFNPGGYSRMSFKTQVISID